MTKRGSMVPVNQKDSHFLEIIAKKSDGKIRGLHITMGYFHLDKSVLKFSYLIDKSHHLIAIRTKDPILSYVV